MQKRVAVVIVNWNSKQNTRECLLSLAKISVTGIDCQTILVDNASTDGSVSVLRREFPEVIVIQNSRNMGFTGGNNAGIRAALARDAQFVWLLNNDTVVGDGTLDALLKAMQPGVGVMGSKIYFFSGREFHKERYAESDLGKVLWYAGGTIDWKNMYTFHRGVDEVDRGQFDTPGETDFITGCSMCIRKEVFDAIGLFDERYYLYLEDVDFCIRARHAGFSLMYEPSSRIWHKNAGSTDRPGNELQQYYLTRNRLIIGMSYAPVRTKAALFREAMRMLYSGSPVQRKAVRDWAIGKTGNQFTWTS